MQEERGGRTLPSSCKSSDALTKQQAPCTQKAPAPVTRPEQRTMWRMPGNRNYTPPPSPPPRVPSVKLFHHCIKTRENFSGLYHSLINNSGKLPSMLSLTQNAISQHPGDCPGLSGWLSIPTPPGTGVTITALCPNLIKHKINSNYGYRKMYLSYNWYLGDPV